MDAFDDSIWSGVIDATHARWRLFARLVGPLAPRLAMGLVCALLVAVVGAIYAYLTGPLLQVVLTGGTEGAGYFSDVLGMVALDVPAGSISIGLIVVVLTLMAALKGGFQLCQTVLLGGATERIGHQLRVTVYRRLVALPMRAHRHHATGDLLVRLSDDSRQWQHAAVEAPLVLIQEGLAAVALLGVALWLSPWLTLAAVFVLPLVGWAIVRISRRVRHASGKGQETLGGLLAQSERTLACIREVKLWGAEQREASRFEATSAQLGHWRFRRVVVRAIGPLCNEVAAALALGAVVLLAVGTHHPGAMAPERLVSFLTAVLLLYRPIKGMSNAVQTISTASASADRIVELLQTPIEQGAGPCVLSRTDSVSRRSGAASPELGQLMAAEAIRFGYTEGGPSVLDSVSLGVRVGEMVAITGRSGSGKSTLLDVLSGLEQWQQGALWWDGERLDTRRSVSRRARLALVPQQPMLLDGTVAENLRYAAPDASELALWEALDAAGLAAEVLAMPRRMDTRLGTGGVSLSVGQIQRLAIGRALLRRARLLLMDEPTSALDAAARRHLVDVLVGLRETLAIVVATHCAELIDLADRVLCLRHGTLVPIGRPQDVGVAANMRDLSGVEADSARIARYSINGTAR